MKKDRLPSPRLTWSVEDAARATGLSPAFFRKIIAAGEFPVVRVGSRVLIRDQDLRDLVDYGTDHFKPKCPACTP
jgi:excisionase family DNA binding protein